MSTDSVKSFSDGTAADTGIPAADNAPKRHAQLGFRERRWVPLWMLAIDAALLQLSVAASLVLREALTPWFPIELDLPNYAGVCVGILSVLIVFWIIGLYPGYGMAGPQRLKRQLGGIVLTFLILSLWDAVVLQRVWSWGILFMTWGFALVLLPLVTSMSIRSFIRRGVWGEPVLLAGPPQEVAAMAENLDTNPELGLVPVGYVSIEAGADVGMPLKIQHLGNLHNANAYSGEVKTILIVRPSRMRRNWANFIETLEFPNIILAPSSFGGRALWASACDLGVTSGLTIHNNLSVPRNHLLKQTFDRVVGIPLFLLSLPIIAVLSLVIMAFSPGNPFYTQVREGRGGKQFRMLKLRSMIHNAERRKVVGVGPNGIERRRHCKPARDPRILPIIGSFLRRSSLDELPQLWNVVKGDMSLVGPRPFPHYHLQAFSPEFRQLRRTAMHGITGLWQIELRSESDIAAQEALDTYYIRNWSLWLDLYILTRTLSAVLAGKGAR